MVTAATLGTSIGASLYGVGNNDLIRGLQSYPFDLKFLGVTIPASSSASSTFDINIFKEAGMRRLLGIKGFAHTTENSVIVTENPTTTVNDDVATITVAASNNDCKRFYVLVGI